MITSYSDRFAQRALTNAPTHRHKTIDDLHRQGMLMREVVPMGLDRWAVVNEEHQVAMVEFTGTCPKYRSCLKCRLCDICYHNFKCNCGKYTNFREICPHTHAVMAHNAELRSRLDGTLDRDEYSMLLETRVSRVRGCSNTDIGTIDAEKQKQLLLSALLKKSAVTPLSVGSPDSMAGGSRTQQTPTEESFDLQLPLDDGFSEVFKKSEAGAVKSFVSWVQDTRSRADVQNTLKEHRKVAKYLKGLTQGGTVPTNTKCLPQSYYPTRQN